MMRPPRISAGPRPRLLVSVPKRSRTPLGKPGTSSGWTAGSGRRFGRSSTCARAADAAHTLARRRPKATRRTIGASIPRERITRQAKCARQERPRSSETRPALLERDSAYDPLHMIYLHEMHRVRSGQTQALLGAVERDYLPLA